MIMTETRTRLIFNIGSMVLVWVRLLWNRTTAAFLFVGGNEKLSRATWCSARNTMGHKVVRANSVHQFSPDRFCVTPELLGAEHVFDYSEDKYPSQFQTHEKRARTCPANFGAWNVISGGQREMYRLNTRSTESKCRSLSATKSLFRNKLSKSHLARMNCLQSRKESALTS